MTAGTRSPSTAVAPPPPPAMRPMTTTTTTTTNQDDDNHITIFILLLCFLPLFYELSTPTITPSPKLTLNDIQLYTFNISTTNSTLTSILQITISSQNPTPDSVINFDNVEVYASYRNQPITLPTAIPPTSVVHPNVAVWSLYLNGTDVRVDRDVAVSLAQDVAAGEVLINVEARGQLSSDRGSGTVDNYELNESCPGYAVFGNKTMTDGYNFVTFEECYSN